MTPDSARETEKYVLDRLLEALRELPQVAGVTDTGGSDRHLDAIVHFMAADTQIDLWVEIKKTVYPRDVHQALWQFARYVREEAPGARRSVVPMLAAESISPGAKDLLREEDVGYYDTGGSLFIPAPGAYIYVDKPPPKTLEKTVRSVFKGKRAQVVHALLLKPDEWFGATALAELAEVAPSTASETLIALERFDWLKSRGQGPAKERCLTVPGPLLDEWSNQIKAARPRPERRYYVPRAEPDTIVERLAASCRAHHVPYVITREAAAQRYAPFLSALSRVTCRIKPGRAADDAMAELGARSVSEGANLSVIETPTTGEFLFKERVDDAWLASPVQVYLDLLTAEGRSREMAEHLRRERIGF